ncbi:MAG: multicopper oxidase family protein [Bacilli bacterium]
MKKKIIIIGLVSIIIFSFVKIVGFNNNQGSQNNIKAKVDTRDSKYEIANNNDQQTSKSFNIYIKEATIELNNKQVKRWVYTDESNQVLDGGYPIIANVGDHVTINVVNQTKVATNIHWHGLSLPNDQDGASLLIEPDETHQYSFVLNKAGTYWYHAHERPVEDQVDGGMYAPFIVKDAIDQEYDQDYILSLDDWSTKSTNESQQMHRMPVIGNVDTVNGKTSFDINPITIKTNQLSKLRFINSSASLYHELEFPVAVRVTHTDGQPLAQTYTTTKLVLAPGERYDVELLINETKDLNLWITNQRNKGLRIPIIYTYQKDTTPTISPFKANEQAMPIKSDVDYNLDFSFNGMKNNQMEWVINGKPYLEDEPLQFKLNQTYILTFTNTKGHQLDHPVHIHGAHFYVLEYNGKKVDSTILKDTINLEPNGVVKVAITFDQVGEWMIHCHILNHEDNGMMTSIIVKP